MFYDYICHECGEEREVNHSITEDPEISCEICGSIMKRIITGGAGVHYKGSGWAKESDHFRGAQSGVSKTSMKVRKEEIG